MGPGVELVRAGGVIDADHPQVVAWAEAHRGDPRRSHREQCVDLYYAVRDGFAYSPWGASLERDRYRASAILARGEARGHCIDKAIVLAACARHIGVPARLHFANVRNHLGTASFERVIGTDLLVFHGYAALYLDEQWVAATPAFNRQLCDRLGVAALEFDGCSDSIFQASDRAGGRFMEYVHDYGWFADLPFELMVSEWQRHYPEIMAAGRWPEHPEAR